MASLSHRCSVAPGQRGAAHARLARSAPRTPSATRNIIARFQITFKLPSGEAKVADVPPDTYILDAAEDAGIELPYSCRSGTCSTCAGRVEGAPDAVSQEDQSFLDPDQMAKGLVLLCVAYATRDCTILTNQEDAVMSG